MKAKDIASGMLNKDHQQQSQLLCSLVIPQALSCVTLHFAFASIVIVTLHFAVASIVISHFVFCLCKHCDFSHSALCLCKIQGPMQD